jgi:peroxiredoxin Q/BCP
VLYVSLDTAEKNAEFAASLSTDVPVLSDSDGAVARRYGVLGFAGLYSRRWTFYIDVDGVLRDIDKQVEPATAGADIVSKLTLLGFPKRASTSIPPDPATAPTLGN